MENEKLLRLADVEIVVGLKKSSLYNLINEGRFPKPVKLGKRAVRWRYSDLQKFISHLSSSEEVAV